MSGLGHVWLVGAGPGDPGLITRAGLAALRQAEVVVFDRLGTAALLPEAPPTALLIDAGKAANQHTLTQDEINTLLIEHGRAGRRVVRLKGGDPFVFGRGGEEALALAAAGVPCSVIPGVTSAIGGLAAAGVPVTHRAVATSFAVVTGHEDPAKPERGVDWTRLATAADTLVILMGVGRLSEIAAALITGGRSPSTPAAVVEHASTERQRVVTATLATLPQAAADAGTQAPALIVVGDVAGIQEHLDPSRLAPLAGKRVLVPRTRAQSSALVDALRLHGAIPVVLPAIEIERRSDPAALQEAIEALRRGTVNWTVFTSANGVEVCLDAFIAAGADARILATSRIAAIGPATAQALRQRGLLADLLAPDAIGEALGEALRPHVAGATVLLPRAIGARDALPEALRADGATVRVLDLYLAAPPAQPSPALLEAIRAGRVDVACFTSASTVRNLAQMLNGDLAPLRDAVVACIGPIAAEEARRHGLHVDVVAEPHTIEALVEATRRFLHAGTHPTTLPGAQDGDSR